MQKREEWGGPREPEEGEDLSLMLKGSDKDFLQQVRASGMGEGKKGGEKDFFQKMESLLKSWWDFLWVFMGYEL